jgi:type II secretory pathway component HofQ
MGWARALIVATVMTGCCSAPSSPSPPPKKAETAPEARKIEVIEKQVPRTSPRVSFAVEGASIQEVVDLIGRQAGRNIIVEPGVHETVSLTLRDIDWYEALSIVARQTRCEIEVMGTGGALYVTDPPRVTIQTE